MAPEGGQSHDVIVAALGMMYYANESGEIIDYPSVEQIEDLNIEALRIRAASLAE